MDILILGNGFDLAHGLKTKYSDFIDYCKKKYITTQTKDFDKNNNFVFDNIWVKHFLNKTLSGDKWIDLEKEIYNVIVKVSKLPYFRGNVSDQKYEGTVFFVGKYYFDFTFDEVSKYFHTIGGIASTKDCYYVPVKDFIEFLYDQLRDFAKEFEKYLMEEEQSTTDVHRYDLRISKKCASLLNFNYTDTCEHLYDINFNYNDCRIKTKAVYVHGKINEGADCNLVLGTHNFDNGQIPVAFNLFKKHNQRHKYGTIEPYQELLDELKYPQKIYTPVFHIVGHSLDKTDHSILKNILLARKKSVINVYYHDEEAQERLINNITEIIGEEEVMEKVRFIKQDDPKRGILIPIEEPALVEN